MKTLLTSLFIVLSKISFEQLAQNENIEIFIYPNPSSKSIFVELPKISKSPIQIFDINGRLINEIKSSDLHFQIDISHLQSGVYLFKFDFNGDTKIKRIIIE